MPDRDQTALLTSLEKQLEFGSLNDVAVMQATEATPNYSILPWVNVVKIGGQSIIDRGRSAVYPRVEEIVANLGKHAGIAGIAGREFQRRDAVWSRGNAQRELQRRLGRAHIRRTRQRTLRDLTLHHGWVIAHADLLVGKSLPETCSVELLLWLYPRDSNERRIDRLAGTLRYRLPIAAEAEPTPAVAE